ncbi:MTERF6 [Scenedesmus sp. PABB004]|nr:MTERF6 [Scenedesmus sp. PABB004]
MAVAMARGAAAAAPARPGRSRPPRAASSGQRPLAPPPRARHAAAAGRRRVAAAAGAPEAQSARGSGLAGQVDPTYLAAAAYLKQIGLTNTAEIARVLDIATNPNSLFVQYNDAKRSVNANARPLSVEQDMQPVVAFLQGQGLSQQQIVAVVTAHPPVLSYDVAGRLAPFFDFLASVGVSDVGAAVSRRPSLLGLDVDGGLRKIVDYLQYVDTPPDKIVQYITQSI